MAEAHLTAALDLAEACGAPFERALTLLALAELRAATGAPDEAGTLLDEVRGICAPLGAAPTLARAVALASRLTAKPTVESQPAGLTQREADILSALAEGLSNKQIARQFWLSEQTIKFHLTNIYRKLEVSSRTEAVRHAYERGLIENPMLRAVGR